MTKFEKLTNIITKEYIEKLYETHSDKMMCEELSIRKQTLNKLLNFYSIRNHTKTENTKLTNLNKYGVENVYQSSTVIDKIKKTKLEKYGDENYNNPNKIKNTCIERYGTLSASGNFEIKNKIRQTNLERYGVENVFQDVNNISKKCIEKYGSLDDYYRYQQEKRVESLNAKYGVSNSIQIPGVIEKVVIKRKATCMEKYGVESPTLLPQCIFSCGNSSLSKPNLMFASILDKYNLNYEREFSLKSFSYDFLLTDYNTLIEINPSETHNSTWSPFGEKSVKNRDYHLKKSLNAWKYNYKCVHIWDWDDKEAIINGIINGVCFNDLDKCLYKGSIKDIVEKKYIYNRKKKSLISDCSFINKDCVIIFGVGVLNQVRGNA